MTIIYLLGTNTFVPVANRIADRFGYKKIFCLGVAFFTIGTGGVGLSRDFLSLAASRLFEGVGAGLIFPLSLALLVKEFSKEKLGIVINLYLALSLTIGFGFGPIFSGYCAMHFVWNTAFLSLLPFCLLTFVLGCICHEETKKIYRGAFDIRGFFLFTCSISLILVALSEGNLPSTAEGWRSPYILSCLSCFCFFFLGAILMESRVENPMIPLALFRYPAFNLGCITLFTVGMIAFSSINLLVQYLEKGLFYDHGRIGYIASFYGLSLGLGGMLATYLMRTLSAKILSLSGLCLLIISLLLNQQFTIQSAESSIAMLVFLRGFSLGLSIGPVTSSSLETLPAPLASDGSSMVTFFRQIGATFGGSILGIIALRRNIYHKQLFMESVHQNLSAYTNAMHNLEKSIFAQNRDQAKGRALQEIVDYIYRQAYIESLNNALLSFAYVIGMIVCILCIINIRDYWYKQLREKNYLEE